MDGLDGCGKSTHAERIKRYLDSKGIDNRIVAHPSERLFGRLTKRSLQGSGPMARVFATAFFTLDVISSVPLLKRDNETVTIMVRYLLGTAYLPEPLAGYGYLVFSKALPSPDLAFFIDIDPEVAERRIAARGHAREMFETREKLRSVRKVAKRLAKDWITIDNSEDGEGPFLEVERVLNERFRP